MKCPHCNKNIEESNPLNQLKVHILNNIHKVKGEIARRIACHGENADLVTKQRNVAKWESWKAAIEELEESKAKE